MSKILLAVISVTLLMVPVPEAQGCFSAAHCCNENEITHFGTQVNRKVRERRSMASSDECQASSEGTVNKRSVSPWKYVEDFDNSRYPQRLWHAQCNCLNHCLSLNSCTVQGNERTYTKQAPNGNVVHVQHHTVVFYRRPCPEKANFYYLETQPYLVNVSCACVAARGGRCTQSQ